MPRGYDGDTARTTSSTHQVMTHIGVLVKSSDTMGRAPKNHKQGGGGVSGGNEARILGYNMTPALQAIGHCPHCSKSVPNVALSSPSGYRMFLGPTWVTSTLPPTGPD